MNKLFYLAAVATGLFSCSPQTETRAHMDAIGDRTSDSILRLVDSSLANPNSELQFTVLKITQPDGK